MNSNFVDDGTQQEADQWLAVSKSVKSGEDVDGFTDDIARRDPSTPNMAQPKTDQSVKAQSNAQSNQAATTNAQSSQTSGSDPIYGSLGPRGCDDKDFANEEQRLMDKLRNSVPAKFEDDPEIHDATQKSISWAEGNLGEPLRDPNQHKQSWWYFDLDAKRNEGLDPGEKVDRGPIYHYSETHDKDTDDTLKSARLAEDFFGVRHPNRYTGEFDDNGNHIAKKNAGKGQYQTPGAHAGLTGDYAVPGAGGVEVVKYDKNGFPLDKNGKKIKKKDEYDPEDPLGLSGYCGAPLDPNDPDYQEDMAKNPNNKYYGNFTGPRPKDWWNHLIKDKQAPAGFPADGMLSSKILNAGNKDKLKQKYGTEWDRLSPDQQDKLQKEAMDQEEVEKGREAQKGKLSQKDLDIVKAMDQVEQATHWVNYTARENPAPPAPKTQEEVEKEERENPKKDKDHEEGEDDDHDEGKKPKKEEGEGHHEEGEDHDEGKGKEQEKEGDHEEKEGDHEEKEGDHEEKEGEKEGAGEGAHAEKEEHHEEGPDPDEKDEEKPDSEKTKEEKEHDKEEKKEEEKEAEEKVHEEEEHKKEEEKKEKKEKAKEPAPGPAPAPGKPEADHHDQGAAPAPEKAPEKEDHDEGEDHHEEQEKKPKNKHEEKEAVEKEEHKEEKIPKPDPITDADHVPRNKNPPAEKNPDEQDPRPKKSGHGGGHGPKKKKGGHGHGGGGGRGGGHGAKKGGHGGGHGPKKGGHGGHGPKKAGGGGGGRGMGRPGGRAAPKRKSRHNHGPGGHTHAQIPVSSSSWASPEVQQKGRDAKEQVDMNAQMRAMQNEINSFNSVYVENYKIAIDSDNVSKQNQASKFMHYDDDLMEQEVVQLKDELQSIPDEDDSDFLQIEVSNQQKLSAMMHLDKFYVQNE